MQGRLVLGAGATGPEGAGRHQGAAFQLSDSNQYFGYHRWSLGQKGCSLWVHVTDTCIWLPWASRAQEVLETQRGMNSVGGRSGGSPVT